MRYPLLLILCSTLLNGCATISSRGFDVVNGEVRYFDAASRPHYLHGADPTTFRFVGGGYGKDKNHVFYEELVKGADPKTFVALGGGVGRDAKAVYFRERKCMTCDPKSFHKIASDWYADKHSAYRDYQAVPGVDTATLKEINVWFSKDAHSVFLDKEKIPGADAASFKLEDCPGSRVNGEDKNRCYWYEHAVPCNCARNNRVFPFQVPKLSPTQALLVTSEPVEIGIGHKGPGYGLRAYPYWRIEAGQHTVRLTCENSRTKQIEHRQLTLDIVPAHVYRIAQRKNTICGIAVEHPAIVEGRFDGPEITIRLPPGVRDRSVFVGTPALKRLAAMRPKTRVELSAGHHELTAVCRHVTRTGIQQGSDDLTLNLKPGRMYKLDATFEPPQYRCAVRVHMLGN